MDEIRFISILETDDGIKEKVREWRNKDAVRSRMLTQHFIGPGEHADWLKGLKDRKDQRVWVVFAGEVPVGSANFQNMRYEDLSAEWGFYIGEDDYRGKGLGKRMLFRLLEIFFDEMKFRTLLTKTLSTNAAALGLYKKFGFRQTGAEPFDEKQNVVNFEFSLEDWQRRKRQLKRWM